MRARKGSAPLCLTVSFSTRTSCLILRIVAVDVQLQLLTGYHSATFGLNCSEIPNSCPLFEFFLLKYICDMLADISLARLEQVNNLRLSQPDRLVLQTHLKTDRTIGLIKYYFSANLFIPNTNQLVRITWMFLSLNITTNSCLSIPE